MFALAEPSTDSRIIRPASTSLDDFNILLRENIMNFKNTLLASIALMAVSAPALADDKRMYEQNRAQYITYEQAREIAMNKIKTIGGGTVEKSDVDFEYSKSRGAYFEVDVKDVNGRYWEVKVDAKTGEVLKIED